MMPLCEMSFRHADKAVKIAREVGQRSSLPRRFVDEGNQDRIFQQYIKAVQALSRSDPSAASVTPSPSGVIYATARPQS
jgi:hypothetical protein